MVNKDIINNNVVSVVLDESRYVHLIIICELFAQLSS